MAFKKSPPSSAVPESPDRLFLELPRRKYPDLLPIQQEVLRAYAGSSLNSRDVALQLPTGSGKTLVGLLLAEWLRRRNHERVVYLCPTKQLVNQVTEQAEEKYGLTALAFTGRIVDYPPADKTKYREAEHVAVTTYSSIFNTNPYFDDADVLILDDAHAAENYVAALWTVRLERQNESHAVLWKALAPLLKPFLSSTEYIDAFGPSDGQVTADWVEKLATPHFASIHSEFSSILDVHLVGKSENYQWSLLREHLTGCHLYLSPNEILLRPLIPPTSTHSAFVTPRQRVYMSATLGACGDLERLVGRSPIDRVPVPEGWDRHGVGRRFFVFPEMSMEEGEVTRLRSELMVLANRSVVLVPSKPRQTAASTEIQKRIGFTVFDADSIEQSKKAFVASDRAVAVLANRYDGMDFPGEDCRLLFVEGFPKAMNLQERFIMLRMGAPLLFNERIQTRVLQAVGRCTRSLQDYSAVVVVGTELQDYLTDYRRRKYLHPEIQAELAFGIDQSKEVTVETIVDNFKIFLANGAEWEQANQEIVARRSTMTRESIPGLDELANAVADEIRYQDYLWQGDYENASERAQAVLALLTHENLRGYRALWNYLAGSSVRLGASEGAPLPRIKAVQHFAAAKKAAPNVPWLIKLARFETEVKEPAQTRDASGEQIERIEAVLTEIGLLHDRKLVQREKQILEGLASEDAKQFEGAHRLLGDLLGFKAGKVEGEGTPDPWWIIGDLCFVFEDHSNGKAGSSLNVEKARQAASHPNWMRANVEESKECQILAVLVTPVTLVRKAARPHLGNVALWPLDDFRAWASNSLAVLRKLRTEFSEAGNLIWRAHAAAELEKERIDGRCLHTYLSGCLAKNLLGVSE